MSLTAFTSRLGLSQGRVALEPSGADQVFVLGDLEPGRKFELTGGDYAEVSQVADLTGVALVRLRARLKVAATTPLNLRWKVSLRIDGLELAKAVGVSGRERTFADLAANVSKLSGTHDVAVRLELVEA